MTELITIKSSVGNEYLAKLQIESVRGNLYECFSADGKSIGYIVGKDGINGPLSKNETAAKNLFQTIMFNRLPFRIREKVK